MRSFASILSRSVSLPALTAVLLMCGTVAAQEPIVRWTFDEGVGPALDSGTSPAADGILRSNTARTANTPGGFSPFALDLSAEGAESWLNAGDVKKVDTLAQFTMSTWILLKGLNADQDGSGNVRLLAKQAGGSFPGFSWNFNNPNEGDRGVDNFRLAMFLGVVDEAGETFTFDFSTEDIGADDEWVFVAVSYDGTSEDDNLKFYFGDETAEVAQLGETLSVFGAEVNSSAGLANLSIGNTDAAAGLDFALDGYQDDVRIYDQILTADDLELVRLSNLMSLLTGDFNNNGVLDAPDIDELTRQSASAANDPVFDLNQDSLVNSTDIDLWISDLFNSWLGDADLDGEFNSGDLVTVLASGTYEQDIESIWSTGDFNGDGRTDSSDLVTALAGGGYENGPRAAVRAVPEPTSVVLFAMAVGLLIRRRPSGCGFQPQ